jgi:hypothetical protein
MKQTKYIIIGALLLLGIEGCKDEINNNPKIKLSFYPQNNGIGFMENSLTSIVNDYGPFLNLNEPLQKDLRVQIEYTGTATYDQDYTIQQPVIFTRGSVMAPLGLKILDDNTDEFDESIKFKIRSCDDPTVEIDTVSFKVLITDNENSDLRVLIGWPLFGNTGSDNIDFDLYLWRESSPGSNTFNLVTKKTNHNHVGSGNEGILLSGLEKDGVYGLSYVYYNGNSDNISFTTYFQPVDQATVEGSTKQIEFTATYNLININKGDVVIREQFFTKSGFDFKNFTPITVPQIGS